MKILYWIQKKEHVRVVQCLKPIKDVTQSIIMPSFIHPNKMSLPVIKYDYMANFKIEVKKFKPDAITSCSNSQSWIKKFNKYGYKNVYMSHGLIDGISKGSLSIPESEYWHNFDLFCVGDKNYRDLLGKNPGVTGKIITNAMPQFDILYYTQKKALDESTKNKTIVLFGHPVGRQEFVHHDRALFDTIFGLSDLSKKHSWTVFVKPKKGNYSQFIKNRVKKGIFPKEFIEKYRELGSNGNIRILSPYADPYTYFGADAIVCSARSTIHVEACLAERPLGIITSDIPDGAIPNDVFGTLDFGASSIVRFETLEEDVINLLNRQGAGKTQTCMCNIDFFFPLGLWPNMIS